jgi:hypothetical protein
LFVFDPQLKGKNSIQITPLPVTRIADIHGQKLPPVATCPLLAIVGNHWPKCESPRVIRIADVRCQEVPTNATAKLHRARTVIAQEKPRSALEKS